MRVSRLDRPRCSRVSRFLLAAAACAACALHASAEDGADRLRLQALIEEAGLIMDEVAHLRPAAERLAAEGAQLDAAEQALHAEQIRLNEEIVRFNARNVELERQSQEYRAKCRPGSEDAALVEACNARATQFNAAAREHEAQRPLLQERQRELPGRIQAQKAARGEWALRKNELDPKVQANRADAEYWLASARTFLASDAFGVLAKTADAPAACSARTLGDLNAPPAPAAVERALRCFEALAGSAG